MSTNKLRLRNLELLIAQWDNASALAKRLGMNGPSYLSQLTKGARPFSEKTARKWELELGLAPGWFDQDHTNLPNAPAAVDADTLQLVVRRTMEILREVRLTLSPVKLAELVALVYEETSRTKQLDETYIRRIINLLKE